MEDIQKDSKKKKKYIKTKTFTITIWGAIEKSPILLSQFGTNNILHFGCTNIIFADCNFSCLKFAFCIFQDSAFSNRGRDIEGG